jgi:hypothetical protein
MARTNFALMLGAALLAGAMSFALQFMYINAFTEAPVRPVVQLAVGLGAMWLVLSIASVTKFGLRGLWALLPMPFVFYAPGLVLLIAVACGLNRNECL